MVQPETTASQGRAAPMPERRSEVRKPTAIHAFASDTNNKYNVKCMIRNVSPSGCKIVSNSMDDLPGLIYLLPEKFEKPILGRIIWRKKNMGGVQFLSADEGRGEDCLWVAPVENYHEHGEACTRERARLYSCAPPLGFRDRFQIFSGPRERGQQTGQVPHRNPIRNAVATMAHKLREMLSSFLAVLGFGSEGEQADADISAEPSLATSPLELVALLRQCVDENVAVADKYGVGLRLDERVGSVRVRADSDAIKRVLSELLVNAAKASPENEQVEVAVERCGTEVRIAVRDHGLGMPLEEQQRYFHDPIGAGGKGLQICRSIVEKHGARLQIKSDPGEGSTIFFNLPEIP